MKKEAYGTKSTEKEEEEEKYLLDDLFLRVCAQIYIMYKKEEKERVRRKN